MKPPVPHLMVALLAGALLVTGCGGSGNQAASAPLPPRVPGQVVAAPDLTGVKLPNFIMPLISGVVSVPRHNLTPGAVTTTDTTTVCNLPPAATSVPIPAGLDNAVLSSYGYLNPSVQGKYILTYLVPVALGGAVTQANIWPASLQGTGFFQKIQLDHILKSLVCRRFLTLKQAQRALERNWYLAWLKYVVATGHL
jgi:hypothetical protein